MRILLIIFLLTFVIGCNVQTETVANDSKSIKNQSIAQTTSETEYSIYDVDFKNFTYPWTEAFGDVGKSFTLKNGGFSEEDGRNLSLEGINYQEDYTLVTVRVDDGNATNYILYIYDLDENNKLKLVQDYEFSETNEQLATAFIAHGELIIEKYKIVGSDAQCCPSIIERQYYQWKDEKFVLIDTQKIENNYVERLRINRK